MIDKNEKEHIKDISGEVKVGEKCYPQIYSYSLMDFPEEKGWQKIGYTERYDVDKRIKEQTKTAAMTLMYEKIWSHSAKYDNGGDWFTDKDFHRFLVREGIPRSTDEGSGVSGTEKFYFNGEPEKSKILFDEFRSCKMSDPTGIIDYSLRPEQKTAVDMTVKYALENQTHDFENPNPKANFLWNAKPRFGKTLTSYDFMRNFVNASTGEKGAKSVLIMTNRPAIANSWFDDYKKFINGLDGYQFISNVESIKEHAYTLEEFDRIENENKRKIVFLSLQDLKGGKEFGGKFDKLKRIKKEEWDLVIVDEAHEGTDTDRMSSVYDKLKRRFTLHLSGTPFRQIADGRYSKDQIYNWTYLDEQKAKEEEEARGDETGPHINMPKLRFFAYEMSQVMLDMVNEGININGKNVAFNYDGLNGFFAAKNGKFIHESHVRRFLDALTKNTKYPFSSPELRNELKHTFWWVGNRVESVKAMKNMLATHPVFKEYEVVAAVGKGSAKNSSYYEESLSEEDNRASLKKVHDAIKKHDKTITLSVGQLTTGVTVKEWSAVLMLSDTKSDVQYTQAIFRAQNPHSYSLANGEIFRKKSAYVFDFSLVRILETFDKLANSLVSERALGELTQEDRKENNRELLNYMPVIAQDEQGRMIELDAAKVLTFPEAAKAKEVVKRLFISNFLFADGLSVFRLPTKLRSRIDKLKETRDDSKIIGNTNIDTTTTETQKTKQRQERRERNRRAVFGDKIYGNEIDAVVTEAFTFGYNQNVNSEIIKGVMDIVDEPLVRWREVYNKPKSDVKQKRDEFEEKAKKIIEDYVHPDMTDKDKENLNNELSNLIDDELPNDIISKGEDFLNDKEDQEETDILIRKLKTFTRAIPILVMASDNPENLTIDNIETAVDEETFIEIFTERHGEGKSINDPFTVEDFKMLRDGGTFTEPDGTTIEFKGCFNNYCVNASIKEFIAKRKKITNYLDPKNEEDIFSCIAPQKSNQIFTPRKVINRMLNILEEENPGIFSNPNLTFCDLYIKSGMYLTEIAKRLFKGLADVIPDEKARIKHIFENQLYGFTPTKVLDAIARSFIYGIDSSLSGKNLIQKDLTEDFKEGKTLNMKFDVVIGNPPYQEETKDTSDKPIYNYFMDGAYKMANKVCFITPARFLFNAGKTPKKWNEKMLNDKHLKVALYEQKSDAIFPNTDIKGGVAITYRDINQDFGKIGTFTHYEELNSVLRKVLNFEGFRSIDEIYFGQQKFNLKTLYLKNPEAKNIIGSEGREKRLTSSIFGQLKKIFTNTRNSESDIKIIGVIKNKREWRYISPEYIEEHPNLRKFKVMLPGSNGSGAIGEVLSTPLVGEPLVGEPLVGHTQTFISFGAFETREEAENCMKFIKTKFARTLLGTLKITQSNKKDTWRNVPLQDFTPNSDIDWSKSIPEIDQQLYKKYGLSEEEIAFIEEKVKAME